MKVADMIAARSSEWRELEADVAWLRGTASRRLDPDRTAAFARRYRSACSDLALATGMRFPESTLDYLQQLVADAHTQLYRIERFSILAWLRTLLVDVPRRTVTDPCTWIAAAVFVALFGGGMLAAVLRPGFAEEIVGEGAIMRVEEMYAERPDGEGFTAGRARMAGFYVFNNAGIGLRCFAGGILLGVGSLFVLAFNSLFLGTIFGHMLGSPVADHFAEFVTAHGPFELSAIILSAGCGTPPAAKNPAIPAASASAQLRAGDTLNVNLQGIPDAALHTVQVDEQGAISLPFIGPLPAGGGTTSELAQRIRETYVGRRFYTTVDVSVSVAERFVYVGGEVSKPGRIVWTPDLTAAKAVQSAGGFTPYGKQTAVTLVREKQAYTLDVKLAQRNPSEDPRLMPGDSLQVPRAPF